MTSLMGAVPLSSQCPGSQKVVYLANSQPTSLNLLGLRDEWIWPQYNNSDLSDSFLAV